MKRNGAAISFALVCGLTVTINSAGAEQVPTPAQAPAPTVASVATPTANQPGAQTQLPACQPATASVDAVTRIPRKEASAPTADVTPAPTPVNKNPLVELGDIIQLHVDGLDRLLAEKECRLKRDREDKKLVLFLGGLPIKGSAGTLPEEPKKGLIQFTLQRTSDSKAAWTRVLGRPWFDDPTVSVSIGFEDKYPFDSIAKVDFRVLPRCAVAVAVGLFIVMLGLFLWFAYTSNTLRDDPSVAPVQPTLDATAQTPATPPPPPAYSLSRSQAAWWFFVIFASYMLIAVVTGEYNGTFNSTALILIGIGAATIAGSATVNAVNRSAGDDKAQQDAASKIQGAASAQQRTIDQLKSKPEADLTPTEKAQLTKAKESLEAQKQTYARLANRNQCFITDILSDANGVNLHRFQMVAWTVLLTLIWIKEIWEHLGMPDFDATLLTLQGISAATYVGLKGVEPTVPAQAK